MPVSFETLMEIAQELQSIALQEQTLVFPGFDADIAWSIGTRLRTLAQSRGHALAIEIARFGQPLFFSALSGTTPANGAWVRRKRNVVEHFRISSYAMALRMQQGGHNLSERYGLPAADYAASGGAFPISVAGVGVIGTIVVSGLPHRDDHELVVEALCDELGHDYAKLALPRN